MAADFLSSARENRPQSVVSPSLQTRQAAAIIDHCHWHAGSARRWTGRRTGPAPVRCCHSSQEAGTPPAVSRRRPGARRRADGCGDGRRWRRSLCGSRGAAAPRRTRSAQRGSAPPPTRRRRCLFWTSRRAGSRGSWVRRLGGEARSGERRREENKEEAASRRRSHSHWRDSDTRSVGNRRARVTLGRSRPAVSSVNTIQAAPA